MKDRAGIGNRTGGPAPVAIVARTDGAPKALLRDIFSQKKGLVG